MVDEKKLKADWNGKDDPWLNFWSSQNPSFTNEMNLRPSGYSVQEAVKRMNSIVQFEKEDNILDVGCGNGLTLQELLKYSNNLTGVDYSSRMIYLVKELQKENVKYLVANATSLPFPDNTFDKVISFATLQYFSDRALARQAVYEMYRVCKNKGKILIGDVLDANFFASKDGMTSYMPEELGDGYKSRHFRSYFEPQRRFDLLINKQI